MGEHGFGPETSVGRAQPVRGVLLWQLFGTIRQRAQPDSRFNAVVEFGIAGRRDGSIDRYQLTLKDGRCKASRRDGRRAALTLELEPVALLRLVGGASSAARLLFTRQLTLRGDSGSPWLCPRR